jgi:hypothetical protein
MQIRDIILKKQVAVNEGVFDTLKAAATWEPGETFAQAKAKVKNDAGVQAVAKKAQATWQSYEQQLQKSVAQQAAVTPAPAKDSGTAPAKSAVPAGISKPAAPAPAPGSRIQTPTGAVNKGTDGKWRTVAGEVITNPKDVQELERRSKQQTTLAAQNKQMSAASGIKEAAPGTLSPGGIAIPTGAKTAAPLPTAGAPAVPAPVVNPIEAYKNRTDGKYEQALKGFVQQNLLAGMPYARLQNAQEIDQLINTMSRPENADPKVQAPLWQQLAQATAVAAIIPQSAGGAGPEPTANKQSNDTEKQTQSARELLEPVQQAMKQSQIDLSKPGQVLRSKFTNNETAIRSTGNPNVDAMLLAMGFTI